MGLCGSKSKKAATSTGKEQPATNTLLDSSSAKPATEVTSFNVFLDGSDFSAHLIPAQEAKVLQVDALQGGAIGLWNNRQNTEKLKKGDLVMKVREVGAEWLSGDSKKMLDALMAVGTFELEIQRPAAVAEKKEVAEAGETAETAVVVETAVVAETAGAESAPEEAKTASSAEEAAATDAAAPSTDAVAEDALVVTEEREEAAKPCKWFC